MMDINKTNVNDWDKTLKTILVVWIILWSIVVAIAASQAWWSKEEIKEEIVVVDTWSVFTWSLEPTLWELVEERRQLRLDKQYHIESAEEAHNEVLLLTEQINALEYAWLDYMNPDFNLGLD